jgi:hypothetical protein
MPVLLKRGQFDVSFLTCRALHAFGGGKSGEGRISPSGVESRPLNLCQLAWNGRYRRHFDAEPTLKVLDRNCKFHGTLQTNCKIEI